MSHMARPPVRIAAAVQAPPQTHRHAAALAPTQPASSVANSADAYAELPRYMRPTKAALAAQAAAGQLHGENHPAVNMATGKAAPPAPTATRTPLAALNDRNVTAVPTSRSAGPPLARQLAGLKEPLPTATVAPATPALSAIVPPTAKPAKLSQVAASVPELRPVAAVPNAASELAQLKAENGRLKESLSTAMDAIKAEQAAHAATVAALQDELSQARNALATAVVHTATEIADAVRRAVSTAVSDHEAALAEMKSKLAAAEAANATLTQALAERAPAPNEAADLETMMESMRTMLVKERANRVAVVAELQVTTSVLRQQLGLAHAANAVREQMSDGAIASVPDTTCRPHSEPTASAAVDGAPAEDPTKTW